MITVSVVYTHSYFGEFEIAVKATLLALAKELLIKVGLVAVCSRFDINDASRDPFLLCRTEITGNDSVRVFQQKLHGDWDWYRWRKKDPALIC